MEIKKKRDVDEEKKDNKKKCWVDRDTSMSLSLTLTRGV